MQYMLRRAAALIIAGALSCALLVPAGAHEVPDPDRSGSVTVEMRYGGAPVAGGTLSAYRVGEVAVDDGNYSFVKTAELSDFPGSFEDPSSAPLARQLADFVSRQGIGSCASAANRDGCAVFGNLPLGLYLIVQTEPSGGYEPLNPFLVTIPMNEGGRYVYDINAAGKFRLVQQAETEPPQPNVPADPTLPQTGQLNWPVPLLAAGGLLLFALGWALRSSAGRGRHET